MVVVEEGSDHRDRIAVGEAQRGFARRHPDDRIGVVGRAAHHLGGGALQARERSEGGGPDLRPVVGQAAARRVDVSGVARRCDRPTGVVGLGHSAQIG